MYWAIFNRYYANCFHLNLVTSDLLRINKTVMLNISKVQTIYAFFKEYKGKKVAKGKKAVGKPAKSRKFRGKREKNKTK